MLKYNRASDIAEELYDIHGEFGISYGQIEDYISLHYMDEDEVDGSDISYVYYAYQDLCRNARDSYDWNDSSDDLKNDDRENSMSFKDSYDDYDYDSDYESGYSSNYGSYGGSSYSKNTVKVSKGWNVFFSLLGIFIVFQVIVLLVDSITWGSLIEDFLDPDQLILNLIGWAIFCPIGIGIGKLLQIMCGKY